MSPPRLTVDISAPHASLPENGDAPSPAVRASGRWQRLVRWTIEWAPLVVPLLYLAFVLSVQPADRLGPPAAYPWAPEGLYDDFDFAAMALRGLNASLGRIAGRQDYPDSPERELLPEEFNKQLDAAPGPLLPRYFLEYPHAALLLFRIPFIFFDEPVSAAVLDGSYSSLVFHVPRNEGERRLWSRFRWAARFYITTMIACQLALVVLLRRGYGAGEQLASNCLLLLLPGAIYYTAYRFDIVPALLTALSLACLGRRRILAAAVFLGMASMIKVYPVLLAPLVLRYLWDDRRQRGIWLGAFLATIAAFLLPPLLTSGWEAVWAPYRFQLRREPLLWTAYDYILPKYLEQNDLRGSAFRLGCLVLTVAALALPRVPDLSTLLRRGAVVLIVFVSLAVFYSPQWILWLTPLLLPLATGWRSVTGLVIGLDLITFLTWSVRPDRWYEQTDWISAAWGRHLLDAAVYGRFAVLAALAVVLLWPGWRTAQRPLS